MYDTEIHVKGKLDPNLSDWFGELQIQENTSDVTILHGKLPDMSAVYGVISLLGSLVIPLISVHCIGEYPASSTTIQLDSENSPSDGEFVDGELIQ